VGGLQTRLGSASNSKSDLAVARWTRTLMR
jgi:hypothetical protein